MSDWQARAWVTYETLHQMHPRSVRWWRRLPRWYWWAAGFSCGLALTLVLP